MANRRGRRRGRLPRIIINSRRAFYGTLLFLAGMLALGIASGLMKPVLAPRPLAGQVVYIDPGHGGIDGGASGKKVVEKDVVLNVALYLGVRLEKEGAKVVYTRTGDYDLGGDGKDDVEERIKLIKTSGATIVISLHANAFTDAREWGAQTFYDAARHPESKKLAQLIQAELVLETGTEREASSKLDHFILSHSDIPSVTVELGFLSNPSEEELLGSTSYQQKLADCLRRAVVKFAVGEV